MPSTSTTSYFAGNSDVRDVSVAALFEGGAPQYGYVGGNGDASSADTWDGTTKFESTAPQRWTSSFVILIAFDVSTVLFA